jgi:hypothetical protein
MSTTLASRKRSRRGTTTISDAVKYENSASLLPIELVYAILSISIGEYIADMMFIFDKKVLKWDAIMTFLHVSNMFRTCTIDLLYHLWGDTFIREITM